MLSTRVATRVTLVPFLGTGVFCVFGYLVKFVAFGSYLRLTAELIGAEGARSSKMLPHFLTTRC